MSDELLLVQWGELAEKAFSDILATAEAWRPPENAAWAEARHALLNAERVKRGRGYALRARVSREAARALAEFFLRSRKLPGSDLDSARVMCYKAARRMLELAEKGPKPKPPSRSKEVRFRTREDLPPEFRERALMFLNASIRKAHVCDVVPPPDAPVALRRAILARSAPVCGQYALRRLIADGVLELVDGFRYLCAECVRVIRRESK